MLFEILFQAKKDAFLRNTTNKHPVINVIFIEPKKVRSTAFNLYYYLYYHYQYLLLLWLLLSLLLLLLLLLSLYL